MSDIKRLEETFSARLAEVERLAHDRIDVLQENLMKLAKVMNDPATWNSEFADDEDEPEDQARLKRFGAPAVR